MINPVVSIVIPVYNKESYIKKCLTSVLLQDFNQEKIEIICINDGSTDNSETIIKEISKDHKNIFLYTGSNKGVSHARNIGILNAKGKYILFLDADDYISNETIKELISFFDSIYDEVDLITYNIYYCSDKKIKKGKRGQNLTQNCIIDLTKDVDFSQTTMNICIKNDKKILFDENLQIYEDQLFNTMILKNRVKLGWCNNAKYFYNRAASSTRISNHPYFSYNSMIYFFYKLLEIGEKNKKIGDYCKSLILYNLNWRISSDYFFAYHKNNGKEQICNDMQMILDKIENQLILRNNWLITDYKNFLLNLKSKNKPFIICEDKDMYLCDNSGELGKETKFTLCIQRERIHNCKYKIMGFLKNTAICFSEKPDLYINCSGKIKKIPLYESGNSRFWTKIKTNSYYGMDIEIDLFDKLEISFFVKIKDYKYDINFWFRPFSSISNENNMNIHFSDIFSIEKRNNKLVCYKTNSQYIQNIYKLHLKKIKKEHFGKFLLYKIAKKIKKYKRIWLYSDAKGYYDNAYFQFKHDIKIKDGILKFYIYKDSKENIINFFSKSERLFLIKENSLLHRILFISSEKIFTSFFEKSMYVPYTKSFKFYNDIINFEGIYLQHGIMHANLDYLYSKDISYFIDKIVISTYFEKDVALKKLNFKQEDLIESGQPRYSVLKSSTLENKIIYAPSWRKYMLNHLGPDKWEKQQKTSDFIKEINKFLSNEHFINFLENNNFFLDIKLHRNFTYFFEDISFFSKRINIIDNIEHYNYKLCISDISSIIFDFMFFNIPIIKFIPDVALLKAGLHSYREFNYPFTSVGDCVYSVEELVNKIIKFNINNFNPNYDVSKIFIEDIQFATDKIYKTCKQR